ncbi:MAG: AMP-dependent synthetase [Stygiobacter sp. RIFOXYC12_FULL_38_8]|nr:MAG: AMP-dependent synthetase [Stygiobacter sp. GWC2_38_9]OGV08963.1 MAG: AMP-dependent synthetase [Stygiobacter sp. RIFOXYB2_FULL_37_11]OGV11235.1 MAG: AMP-dependent synthetase [Stygiobacter sp. RIFOXYA2_FULL_38_8]OGV12104.1 MAG: AMP-dependent synthetase [Stygiobacter sp. RIFOXYC2_FULL_38_25]OGV26519.1 MAG: AMP-dependent synthetase [Stygiobacter sp. RIFOXYC12_FULL_38_8]OGV81230.1 MAG: AMP-dependent synthetase [Stygiobacter sp. GWF2_38_21]
MKKELKMYEVPKIESLQDMVLQSARKYGPKIALEDLNDTPLKSLTYRELLDNILLFGSALKQLGLKERSHVALIGENRVQWSLSYLTLMCFNYVIVPIDKNLTTNEIMNIIHESDSEAIIFSGSFASIIADAKNSLKNLNHYICMDATKEDKEFNIMPEMIRKASPLDPSKMPIINPNDLAEIIFTSGSLGRAKGVMLSQRNLASNLMAMTMMINIVETDRFLSVLPIHHTYECTCGMLCPLFAGASAHYARSLKTVVDDLQKVQATILLAVPLLYDKMFKRIMKGIQEDKVKSVIVPPLVKFTNLFTLVGFKEFKKKVFHELHAKFGGSVRLFIAGGAAPDPMVAKGLREFGFNFVQGYGLTETSPILALNRLDAFKDNAAGLPLPGVEIKINNPDEFGIGEIWAKGPSVMLGYYKNEKATQDTFDDGWLKTGDIGFYDEDGFLHINGRKKNVIISKSGKNVFPEEIEDVLVRSPFVLECLVFGEDDPKQGEIISAQIVVDAEAFIELSETQKVKITEELIRKKISEEIEKANKELAAHKMIKKFYIRDNEFEKTTTQKIKRYLVKNPD